ncbi:MAG: DUF924 family protein [Pseudohaliea sp.]
MDPAVVLSFWFEELAPRARFRRSDAVDAAIRERFLDTLEAAAAGELWQWRATPPGRCAEIIVLDQFSRNLFRGSPRAFAQDAMALALAQEAVASGDDRRMNEDQRYFTYMPYMHSESLIVHDEALRLFTALGNATALHYEQRHREEIERFGRYPGRNAALGRENSEAETAWLAAGGGF